MGNEISAGVPFSHQLYTGFTPIRETRSLDAGDLVLDETRVLYGPFPDNCLLWANLCMFKFSDMDTDGAPVLAQDIGIGDIDGVIDTALLAASQAGRTGAWDTVDTGNAVIVDVSGKYLCYKTETAPAAAAAGTIEFFLALAMGLSDKSYPAGVS